jgi:hypothetical protein
MVLNSRLFFSIMFVTARGTAKPSTLHGAVQEPTQLQPPSINSSPLGSVETRCPLLEQSVGSRANP